MMWPWQVKSRIEVEAFKECHDLCINGYTLLFGARDGVNSWVKLRHRTNGRTLMMRINRDRYSIREGARLVKERILPPSLVSD